MWVKLDKACWIFRIDDLDQENNVNSLMRLAPS